MIYITGDTHRDFARLDKMEFNKENHKKNSVSFRLPLQYRRMGSHGKKRGFNSY